MTDFTSKSSINRDTKLCMSLAGRPGNFGSKFQNHLYGELGLDFIYKSFTTTDLPAAIAGVRALGIRGCAVSMPFKEACIPLLDALDPSAAAIGSVNTIVNDGTHLRGYNTDYIAIARLIEQYAIPPDIPLILRGSGGMAKAVACAFRDQGFRNATIVARNQFAGQGLANACGYRWVRDAETIGAQDAAGAVLVNVTPIGMTGSGPEAHLLAFLPDAIKAARMVFDVVAMPIETPLIRVARAVNRPTINGGEVLILQGLEQFALYTGVRPNTEQLARAAAVALAK
jgi:shikimate dehydrogenase